MPTSAEYRDQARHNEQFLHSFWSAQGGYADWAVTVIFYAALNWVQAWLLDKGEDPKTHERRNFLVSNRLPAIGPAYLLLYNRSRLARYECGRAHFSPANVERYRTHELMQIREVTHS